MQDIIEIMKRSSRYIYRMITIVLAIGVISYLAYFTHQNLYQPLSGTGGFEPLVIKDQINIDLANQVVNSAKIKSTATNNLPLIVDVFSR